MSGSFSIPIEIVVDHFGLERKKKNSHGNISFVVRCPFCGHLSMDVNTEKNSYNCFHCNTGAGVLDLYSRIRFGTPCETGAQGNSSKIFFALREELGAVSYDYSASKRDSGKILPAADDQLHRVYSELLALPELALTGKHRKNLLNRGLSDEDIMAGQYGSMISATELLKISGLSAWARDTYAANNMAAEKEKNSITQKMKDETILAGMIIAKRLVDKGVSLTRVPGFYKLANTWVFRGSEGMLIPTRNIKGMIVGMQTRRDAKNAGAMRYMTLSSKGLNGGPTEKIARTHFPLRNASITKATSIVLTEGPLKSDVALKLIRGKVKDVAFIAIQGVNNISDLKSNILPTLKAAGVQSIYMALDMDKICNINVNKASKNIEDVLAINGFTVNVLLWDYASAAKLQGELTCIADENGISLSLPESPFDAVATLSKSIVEAKPELSDVVNNWPRPDTKGIDDFLFQQIH